MKAVRALELLRLENAGARLQVARCRLAIDRRDLLAAERFCADAQLALNRAELAGDDLARTLADGALDRAA